MFVYSAVMCHFLSFHTSAAACDIDDEADGSRSIG